MIRILSLIAMLTFGLGTSATAQDDPIQGVISDQIAAFKVDDFATAFTYASPMIQGVFQTPDRFGLMVQRGFPMVWRPQTVRFTGQRQADGYVYQQVLFQDAAGQFHTFEYQMVQTQAGWKINGVFPISDPGVTA